MMYKACPRCTGDCYMEHGTGYDELVCLQCGFRRSAERRPVEIVNVRGRQILRPIKVAA